MKHLIFHLITSSKKKVEQLRCGLWFKLFVDESKA